LSTHPMEIEETVTRGKKRRAEESENIGGGLEVHEESSESSEVDAFEYEKKTQKKSKN